VGHTAGKQVRVRISSTTIVDATRAASDALVTRMKCSQHELGPDLQSEYSSRL
jgi:hypothetical protein